MRRAAFALACCLPPLAACATLPSPGPSPRMRPVAIGYAPAQRGLETIAARSDLGFYTHINIAFANPDASGAIVAGTNMACMSGGHGGTTSLAAVRTMIAAAHRAGAKALISVGGGIIPSCAGDWEALLRPPFRHALVRQLIRFVDREHLDGLDVDIEGALLTRIDQAGDFTPFIADLGAALRRRGKLLTCATASYEGGMVPVSSIPWFDLIGVMAYDAVGPFWGTPGGEHAPIEQAEHDLALWRARGVAKDRLVLGVPFYGYGYGELKGAYPYRDIITRFGADVNGDVVGERCGGCSYITFNGVETLRRKARLAVEQGGGFMVWEISQDTDDGTLIRNMDAAALGADGAPSPAADPTATPAGAR